MRSKFATELSLAAFSIVPSCTLAPRRRVVRGLDSQYTVMRAVYRMNLWVDPDLACIRLLYQLNFC
jgi:hypothetical protein